MVCGNDSEGHEWWSYRYGMYVGVVKGWDDYISPGGDRTAQVIKGIVNRAPRGGNEKGVGWKVQLKCVKLTTPSSCDHNMHVTLSKVLVTEKLHWLLNHVLWMAISGLAQDCCIFVVNVVGIPDSCTTPLMLMCNCSYDFFLNREILIISDIGDIK